MAFSPGSTTTSLTTFHRHRLPIETIGRIFSFAWSISRAINEEQTYVVTVLLRTKFAICRPYIIDSTAEAGKLNMLKILHQYSDCECTTRAMDSAAALGHLDVVRFLHEHRTEGCTDQAVEVAIVNNHVDMAKFLLKHRKELNPWTTQALVWATTNHDLATVKDVLKNHPETLSAEAKILAYDHKQTEILKYLYEHSTDTRPTLTLVRACRDNDMELIAYLCARGEGFVKTAVSEAVRSGKLAIVQYLLAHAQQNYTEASRVVAMNEAAANGQLEILRYLHEHVSTLACTAKAMNDAAARGHLEIVKFLHENRDEGCTTRAMDLAAANGHLEIVHFLHTNRKEGCTTFAIDQAATHGHVEVLRFLHENRSEGCTSQAFMNAVKYGHAWVVEFLLRQYPESCDVTQGLTLTYQHKLDNIAAILLTYQTA